MSLKEQIKTASNGLDHKKDDDWQEDGRPSLKRIHQLAKTTAITQEQLDDALPDLRRNQSVNQATITPTPDAGKAKANVNPAAAPATAKTATDTAPIVEASKRKKPIKAEDQPMLVNKLVVAVEAGYYGSKIREPGESFYFTGRKGRWMEVADKSERKEHAEERAADA
jgi:hypothetical protein